MSALPDATEPANAMRGGRFMLLQKLLRRDKTPLALLLRPCWSVFSPGWRVWLSIARSILFSTCGSVG